MVAARVVSMMMMMMQRRPLLVVLVLVLVPSSSSQQFLQRRVGFSKFHVRSLLQLFFVDVDDYSTANVVVVVVAAADDIEFVRYCF